MRVKNLAIILIMSIAVSGVILQALMTVNRLKTINEQLMGEDLLFFNKLQEMHQILHQQELLFYRFYLLGEMDNFQYKFQKNASVLREDFKLIRTEYKGVVTEQEVTSSFIQLGNVAKEFNIAMTSPTDWDAARDALSKFEPIAEEISNYSQRLMTRVSQHVIDNAESSIEETQKGVFWISVVSLMLFIISLITVLLNNRLAESLKMQKRLAGFPALNPQPVMSIGHKGQITYANRGAKKTCRSLLGHDDINELLPDNIALLMVSAKNKSENYAANTRFSISNRFFSADLHWLDFIGEYHIYLSDVTDEVIAQKELELMAYYHAISGLPNREQLKITFEKKQFSYLILVEVEPYSEIITTYGHSTAESTIEHVSKRLKNLLRQCDIYIYHIDNNLYGLMLFEASIVETITNKVNQCFADPISINSKELHLHAKFGGTHIENEHDLFECLRRADTALRTIQANSRFSFRSYDDALDNSNKRRAALQTELRHASKQEELLLYYQPIVDAVTRQTVAAEALMRWHLNKKEWISPAEFIPIAEQSDLIGMLSLWTINESFRFVRDIKPRVRGDINIAVNISASQWSDDLLSNHLQASIERFGIEAGLITLEITEEAAISDVDYTITKMQMLKDTGFKIAIDDFGTGFSSLSYLNSLPVDKLKIDKSFVDKIMHDEKNTKIVKAIISLANQLDMQVVAEGIEAPEQADKLQAWGCQFLQGYLFSKPMPESSFTQVIHSTD